MKCFYMSKSLYMKQKTMYPNDAAIGQQTISYTGQVKKTVHCCSSNLKIFQDTRGMDAIVRVDGNLPVFEQIMFLAGISLSGSI